MVVVLSFIKGFDLDKFISTHYNSIYSAIVLLSIFLIKAVTIFFIPQIFCYVTAGLMFPPVKAMLLCCAGLLMEYTINYFAGNKLGKSALDRLWLYFEGKGKKRIQTNIPAVTTLYLLPGASRDLLGMMVGAMNMRFSHYLIASIAGSLPNLVLIVFIGSAVTDLLSPRFIVPVAILIVAGIIAYLVTKRKRKSE